MHKRYINSDLPIVVDYIPEDGKVCANCKFWEICPYDYVCATLDRVMDFENLDNDHSHQRSEEA